MCRLGLVPIMINQSETDKTVKKAEKNQTARDISYIYSLIIRIRSSLRCRRWKTWLTRRATASALVDAGTPSDS